VGIFTTDDFKYHGMNYRNFNIPQSMVLLLLMFVELVVVDYENLDEVFQTEDL
jgi:ACR3 family arsenite efflux pump ArsB